MTETVSIEDARKSIMARWIAQWGETTVWTFDNSRFDPPKPVKPDDVSSDVSAWCRVVVRQLASAQETIGAVGNRKFERQAQVQIQIYVPVDSGTNASDSLIQQARNIFEGTKFDGLIFYAGVAKELGQDGRWYRVDVEVPFTFYDTK